MKGGTITRKVTIDPIHNLYVLSLILFVIFASFNNKSRNTPFVKSGANICAKFDINKYPDNIIENGSDLVI